MGIEKHWSVSRIFNAWYGESRQILRKTESLEYDIEREEESLDEGQWIKHPCPKR